MRALPPLRTLRVCPISALKKSARHLSPRSSRRPRRRRGASTGMRARRVAAIRALGDFSAEQSGGHQTSASCCGAIGPVVEEAAEESARVISELLPKVTPRTACMTGGNAQNWSFVMGTWLSACSLGRPYRGFSEAGDRRFCFDGGISGGLPRMWAAQHECEIVPHRGALRVVSLEVSSRRRSMTTWRGLWVL